MPKRQRLVHWRWLTDGESRKRAMAEEGGSWKSLPWCQLLGIENPFSDVGFHQGYRWRKPQRTGVQCKFCQLQIGATKAPWGCAKRISLGLTLIIKCWWGRQFAIILSCLDFTLGTRICLSMYRNYKAYGCLLFLLHSIWPILWSIQGDAVVFGKVNCLNKVDIPSTALPHVSFGSLEMCLDCQ